MPETKETSLLQQTTVYKSIIKEIPSPSIALQ
jgi:hypothetical protein